MKNNSNPLARAELSLPDLKDGVSCSRSLMKILAKNHRDIKTQGQQTFLAENSVKIKPVDAFFLRGFGIKTAVVKKSPIIGRGRGLVKC